LVLLLKKSFVFPQAESTVLEDSRLRNTVLHNTEFYNLPPTVPKNTQASNILVFGLPSDHELLTLVCWCWLSCACIVSKLCFIQFFCSNLFSSFRNFQSKIFSV